MKQGLGWPIADPEYPPGYLGLHDHGLLEMPWVPSAGDNRKAARTNPYPKSSFSLPLLLEAMQIPPRRASKEEEPGKKEEPYGRDGWNVFAGRFCDSWPAAINLGRMAKE